MCEVKENATVKMFRVYRDGKRVWSAFYESSATDIIRCLSELYPESEFCLKYE